MWKMTRNFHQNFQKWKKVKFHKIFWNFFSITKTKSSLFKSVFIFSTMSQISKTKFHVFWIQVYRNWTKLLTWTCYFSQVSHAFKWIEFPFSFGVKNQFTNSYVKDVENRARSVTIRNSGARSARTEAFKLCTGCQIYS